MVLNEYEEFKTLPSLLLGLEFKLEATGLKCLFLVNIEHPFMA